MDRFWGAAIALVLAAAIVIGKAEARTVSADCSLGEIALHGKVKVVTSFPDLKVKIVDSFPDLKVQVVTSFPDACGQWQFVESFPDFKVQFVNSFPDLEIKYVTSFPGLP
jgi:hypothetical protein